MDNHSEKSEMQRVTNNPFDEYPDEKLKRKFSNMYADIHVHGLKDGLLALSTLHLIENELIERGYNPENCIGPNIT